MTVTAEIAALLEPALSRPGPQPMSAVLNLAPIASLEDRAICRASHAFCLLTSLTDDEIDALAPGDRRLLQGQLERVYRMVTGTAIASGDCKAAVTESGEPKRVKAALLGDLHDGQGQE